MTADRRLWKQRVPLNREVLVCNNLDLRYTTCLDISQSGAFLAADDVPFGNGETLTIIFRSPDLARPIKLTGRIVRVGTKLGTPGFAVQFLDPTSHAWGVVADYIQNA